MPGLRWSKARAGTEFEALGLTLHDMRHTAASAAIAAGADIKAVQTMLGHASAIETLDRYVMNCSSCTACSAFLVPIVVRPISRSNAAPAFPPNQLTLS